MAVRGKFYVSAIERYSYGDNLTITLTAVTRKTGDNAQWAAATPSGSIKMSVSNRDAWPLFEEALNDGRDLYVDFSLVPQPEADEA